MPDITWTEVYGQVNPSPLYGTAVNCSLLNLASDDHLEQLIPDTRILDRTTYWILCSVLILNIFLSESHPWNIKS